MQLKMDRNEVPLIKTTGERESSGAIWIRLKFGEKNSGTEWDCAKELKIWVLVTIEYLRKHIIAQEKFLGEGKGKRWWTW
jgi:hypothetical protein